MDKADSKNPLKKTSHTDQDILLVTLQNHANANLNLLDLEKLKLNAEKNRSSGYQAEPNNMSATNREQPQRMIEKG